MRRKLREENCRVVDVMVQEFRTFVAQNVNNWENEGDGINHGEGRRDRGWTTGKIE